jgi:hypothetical protein
MWIVVWMMLTIVIINNQRHHSAPVPMMPGGQKPVAASKPEVELVLAPAEVKFIEVKPGSPTLVPLQPCAKIMAGEALTATIGGQHQKICVFTYESLLDEPIEVRRQVFDKDRAPEIVLANYEVVIDDEAKFGLDFKPNESDPQAKVCMMRAPFTIPARGKVTLAIYANVGRASKPATYNSVIDLDGWDAFGKVSGNKVALPAPTSKDGNNARPAPLPGSNVVLVP